MPVDVEMAIEHSLRKSRQQKPLARRMASLQRL